MNNLYFDIAATTPLDDDVAQLISQIQTTAFGNPSSIHSFGQKSKAMIERSRLDIANSINCSTSEVLFTCGGSISNNISLLGSVDKISGSMYTDFGW